jgi:hypothetical protein
MLKAIRKAEKIITSRLISTNQETTKEVRGYARGYGVRHVAGYIRRDNGVAQWSQA